MARKGKSTSAKAKSSESTKAVEEKSIEEKSVEEKLSPSDELEVEVEAPKKEAPKKEAPKKEAPKKEAKKKEPEAPKHAPAKPAKTGMKLQDAARRYVIGYKDHWISGIMQFAKSQGFSEPAPPEACKDILRRWGAKVK